MPENECAEPMTEGQSERRSEDTTDAKKCPFCAEQIRPEAIKCRFCGEFLAASGRAEPNRPPVKWYQATGTMIVALLCLGPIALPLVWVNPRYKPTTRVVITVVVLTVTVLCMYLVTQTYQRMIDQFDALGM